VGKGKSSQTLPKKNKEKRDTFHFDGYAVRSDLHRKTRKTSPWKKKKTRDDQGKIGSRGRGGFKGSNELGIEETRKQHVPLTKCKKDCIAAKDDSQVWHHAQRYRKHSVVAKSEVAQSTEKAQRGKGGKVPKIPRAAHQEKQGGKGGGGFRRKNRNKRNKKRKGNSGDKRVRLPGGNTWGGQVRRGTKLVTGKFNPEKTENQTEVPQDTALQNVF